MNIRRVTENDIPSIAALYAIFWDDISDQDSMKQKLAELKDNAHYAFLCAEIDKRIVGTITGIICDDLYGNCRPFLVMENLVTDSKYRTKGVGRALLENIEEFGRKNQCTQVIFITDSNRKEAIAFYEAMGYDAESHIGFKKKLN